MNKKLICGKLIIKKSGDMGRYIILGDMREYIILGDINTHRILRDINNYRNLVYLINS